MQQLNDMTRGSHFGVRVMHVATLVALLLAFTPSAAAQTATPADGFRFGLEVGLGLAFDQEVTTLVGPPTTLEERHKAWVEAIFRDMVAQAKRREIRYVLRVLDSEMVNAFSAPGGFIYLTTGLLEHLGDDTDALANVIGHEIAHVELEHAINQLTRAFEVGIWVGFGSGETKEGELWDRIEQIGAEMLIVGWGRQLELEADALGQQLAAAAGYDPYGLITFFEVVRLVDRLGIEEEPEFPTHPPTLERIQRAQIHASRLEVADRRRPKPTPPVYLLSVSRIIESLNLELALMDEELQ